MNDLIEYRSTIKAIMQRNGMPRSEAARQIGISWGCLERVLNENSEQTIQYKTLQKMKKFIETNKD